MSKANLKDGQIRSIQSLSVGEVLAAGPLSKQPGSIAYRVVLVARNEGAQFVVYTEFFEDGSSSYSEGEYFDKFGLVRATVAFAARVAIHAEFLGSLYRSGMPQVASES